MNTICKHKTIISLALIFCLSVFIWSYPRRAYAIAPAVGLVVAAVLACGSAAGLNYTFSNSGADEIAGRLQAFLDDVHPGVAIADYFSSRGAAIKDGVMYIGKSLYDRIKEFFQWEVTENEITSGSSAVVTSSSSSFSWADGSPFSLTTLTNKRDVTCISNGKVVYLRASSLNGDIGFDNFGDLIEVDPENLGTIFVKQLTDTCYIKLETSLSSNGSIDWKYYRSLDSGSSWTSTYSTIVGNNFDTNNFYSFFTLCDGSYLKCGHDLPIPGVLRRNKQDESNNYLLILSKIPSDIPLSDYENSSVYSSLPSVSSLSLSAGASIDYPTVAEGQSVCVDVGLTSSATADQWADVVIDSAIDGTLSGSISAEDYTVDVVTTPQEIAQEVDTPAEQEVTPTNPDTPSEDVEFDTPSHYSIRDLRSFFPFCIPFDIYAMLALFNAQPVAPSFEWEFEFLNREYSVEIDLQQFDSIALLLRRLEVISFCVGLAVATRKLIKW